MRFKNPISCGKNVSTSIMEGKFSFDLDDKISFTFSIFDIENFVADGLDLHCNFREFKELSLKNTEITKNYWISRSLIHHFDQKNFDVSFEVENQKLVYYDKSSFRPELINQYFLEVYKNVKEYVEKNKTFNISDTELEINTEGLVFKINGVKLNIDKTTKEFIYSELSAHFNEYYSKTLIELKSKVSNKDYSVDFKFIETTGLNTLKYMSEAEMQCFDDMKNVIDIFLPYTFCYYLDCY
jgi:hypothetical protein